MIPWNAIGFNVRPHRFVREYECYPVTMREDVDRGGKMIMPPSALEELTQLNISYPMLFRLTNSKSGRVSHCGVLEFVADEEMVYLPRWMMNNLGLVEGDTVTLESTELPVATYAKFQPQSGDFLDISDSKAVLENTLRNFACLTTGDCIAISYNEKVYEVCVLETLPENAVCIIECDMSVEYVAPVGYGSPVSIQEQREESLERDREFVPFSGQGYVLVRKKKMRDISANTVSEQSTPCKAYTPVRRGVPDYSYTVGVLKFFRDRPKIGEDRACEAEGCATHVKPFSGLGHLLKHKDKNRPNF